MRNGDKDWNIHRSVDLVSKVAFNGAQVAFLPECMEFTLPSQTMAEKIPDGEACKALMQVARQKASYACFRLTEKSDNQIFNLAFIIDKRDKVLCKHRKISELETGHKYYAQEDRLNVVKTEFGMFGLMICADEFTGDRVLSRSLCYIWGQI